MYRSLIEQITLSLVCLMILLAGCKNDEHGLECVDHPLHFMSLVVGQDTIEVGGSTTVTANAEGYELSYEWTASQGFIIPENEASEVTYSASPCSLGEITITCKVTDACDHKETKRITILVL